METVKVVVKGWKSLTVEGQTAGAVFDEVESALRVRDFKVEVVKRGPKKKKEEPK